MGDDGRSERLEGLKEGPRRQINKPGEQALQLRRTAGKTSIVRFMYHFWRDNCLNAPVRVENDLLR